MVRKKGQVKLQQTAFMLIAIILFFVLVGLAFLGYKMSGLKEKATEIQEENAKMLATKMANSPEFSCGNSFGTLKTNCIDIDKVMALKSNIEKYSGFWGIAGISIVRVYPKFSNVNCSLGNYPNCGVLGVYSENKVKGADYSNFVSLCRKELENGETINKCDIGKILVYPIDKRAK